jgi:hypothetical protein
MNIEPIELVLLRIYNLVLSKKQLILSLVFWEYSIEFLNLCNGLKYIPEITSFGKNIFRTKIEKL